ncbi:hypothetical protein DFR86_01000 [Acidianus sulfidivorans JP7]|uniref:ABC transporter ATP-binding protein n=1 Tax=Acidianus sulfidivorans JP7 TaxID=619593 RepID=A0A2U9IJP0_9CREN|nr:hypothetical protein [Acidianus sulfidivorans]AWR96259.1 hypothetical protein DFR86_01000 [Acidianus sulfidivorans JP7]
MSWVLGNVICIIGEYGVSELLDKIIGEYNNKKNSNKKKRMGNKEEEYEVKEKIGKQKRRKNSKEEEEKEDKDEEEEEKIELMSFLPSDIKGLRVIDSNFIESYSALKVKDILYIYNKIYGPSKNLDFWLNFFNLDVNQFKHNLSEFNKFKLEIMKIFFGNTKLVLSENFLENIEEQSKNKALKLLLKSVRYTNSKLIIFMSSLEYLSICDLTYLVYGEVIEKANRNERLLHPYAELLSSTQVKNFGPPLKVGCPFHEYCPYVMKICRVEKPELLGNEHKIACFKEKLS